MGLWRLPERIFIGSVVKRDAGVKGQLRPWSGYAGWVDDKPTLEEPEKGYIEGPPTTDNGKLFPGKLTAELRVKSDIEELPTMDSGKSFLLVGSYILPVSVEPAEEMTIREIRDESKEPIEGGLPQGTIDVFVEANEGIRILVNAKGVDASVYEKAVRSGIITMAKISDDDPYYRPGFVVKEIKPVGGEITRVDNTELYSTVYFTSNWRPSAFHELVKGCEVTVKLDDNEVDTISCVKVGKDENLSKGSVAIARPVKEGETVTVIVKKKRKKGANSEREKALIEIKGEPRMILGPAFKDERALSAKISAENDESDSYVRVKTDYKDFWFFGGWSRLRANGTLDISNSPSVKDDSLNASGDFLFRRLPIASERKALEIGGGSGIEIWYYPEERPVLGGDSFWFDLVANGSITWYWGNLKEQKNLMRAEATPEFHYGLKRPGVSAVEGDLLRKFVYVPGSIFYNFDGIQLGLDVAGTYLFDEKTAIKEVTEGWFTYWAFVLKLDPSYVSSGFPIQLDSQSPVALNIGFAEGRKPPLMEEVDSRMFFDLEFAPNIGTKKEEKK